MSAESTDNLHDIEQARSCIAAGRIASLICVTCLYASGICGREDRNQR